MKNLKLFGKSIICLIIALVCVLAMMTSCNSASDDDDEDEEEEEEENKKENASHKHSYILLDDKYYFVTLQMNGKKATKIDFYCVEDYSQAFTIGLEYNSKKRIDGAFIHKYDEGNEIVECDEYTVEYDKKGKLTYFVINGSENEIFSLSLTENDDGDIGYNVFYNGTLSCFVTLNRDNLIKTLSGVSDYDYGYLDFMLSYDYDIKGRLTEIESDLGIISLARNFEYEKNQCCFFEMSGGEENSDRYVFNRDDDHNVIKVEHLVSDRNYSWEFKYADGRQLLVSSSEIGGDQDSKNVVYQYDENNKLTSCTETKVYVDWDGQIANSLVISEYRPDGSLKNVHSQTTFSLDGVVRKSEDIKTECDENGEYDTYITVIKEFDDKGELNGHVEEHGEYGSYGLEATLRLEYFSTYETYYNWEYGYVYCVEINEYNEAHQVTKTSRTYYTTGVNRTKLVSEEIVNTYTGEFLEKEIETINEYYSNGTVKEYCQNTYTYSTDESYTLVCVEKDYDDKGRLNRHYQSDIKYNSNGNYDSYLDFYYLETFEAEYNGVPAWCEQVKDYDDEGNVIKEVHYYYTNDDNRTLLAVSEYREENKDGLLYTWTQISENGVTIYYEETIESEGYWSNTMVYRITREYDSTGALVREEETNYYSNGNAQNQVVKIYAFGKVVTHSYYEFYSYGWTKVHYDYVTAIKDYNDNVIGRIVRDYTEGENPYVFRTTTEYFDENGNVIDSVVENHDF